MTPYFFQAAFARESQNNLVEYDYDCIYRFYSDYIRQRGGEFTEEIDFLLLSLIADNSSYPQSQVILNLAVIA